MAASAIFCVSEASGTAQPGTEYFSIAPGRTSRGIVKNAPDFREVRAFGGDPIRERSQILGRIAGPVNSRRAVKTVVPDARRKLPAPWQTRRIGRRQHDPEVLEQPLDLGTGPARVTRLTDDRYVGALPQQAKKRSGNRRVPLGAWRELQQQHRQLRAQAAHRREKGLNLPFAATQCAVMGDRPRDLDAEPKVAPGGSGPPLVGSSLMLSIERRVDLNAVKAARVMLQMRYAWLSMPSLVARIGPSGGADTDYRRQGSPPMRPVPDV